MTGLETLAGPGPAVLVCAAATAVAAGMSVPPRPTGRRPGGTGHGALGHGGLVHGGLTEGSVAQVEHDLLIRHRPGLSLLAALAAFLFLGGWLGAAASVVAALVAWRVLGAREPAASRRRGERLSRQLPHAVDLLAVTMSAGASPPTAVAMVADAIERPLSEELHSVRRSLVLGRDPVLVWRELGARPGLGPLGRAMVRAVETGSPVSDTLHRLAGDLHAAARAQAEGRARAVGVRAAAPLGLCLLPAFVLTGVVPLVAATIGELLRW